MRGVPPAWSVPGRGTVGSDPGGQPAGEGAGGRAAVRWRRPSWRDGRFLVGLALVLGSVLLGTWVVAEADRTVPVWAAGRTLPVGAELTPETLVRTRVRLGVGTGAYLDARHDPPSGLVVLRPVGAGELLPRSALGTSARSVLRPVTVPVPGPLPADLRPGAVVDVWSAARTEGLDAASHAPARLLVPAAAVHAVNRDQDAFATTENAGVEVLVGPAELPAVLDALAADAWVALLVVSGPPEGEDRR